MKKSSWKTTVGGILTAIGLGLSQNLPDNKWARTAGDLLCLIGPLILGWAARDNNVSSEQAGAK